MIDIVDNSLVRAEARATDHAGAAVLAAIAAERDKFIKCLRQARALLVLDRDGAFSKERLRRARELLLRYERSLLR